MPEQPPIALPTLVSLLICDQVIDDKITNKKSAIGLFNTILVPRLPAVIHQLVVMASVTEIEGHIELEMRMVRDADNEVVVRAHGPIEAPSPLAVVDLVFNMQGIQVPTHGQYAFEVLCSGEVLGRRRFQIIHRPPPARPEPHGGPAGG